MTEVWGIFRKEDEQMGTFSPADILIPQNIEFEKWSVIACDQYTSDRKYWKEVEKEIGDSPSALKIILPEVYLDDGDTKQRIENINSEMRKYLENDLFFEYKDSFIYTERIFRNGKIRRGIIGKLDLDDYSYIVGEETPVRATEGTVLERIPPRVKIRENAPLEIPHIMVLIDDEEDIVISAAKAGTEKTVYDFELMKGGGHITGKTVSEKGKKEILAAIEKLTLPSVFLKKYGVKNKKPLVFAVGDGNHSLATAKACKSRYALVELVNLHDPSLVFEPIHRVVFDTDPVKMLDELVSKSGDIGLSIDDSVSSDAKQIFLVLYGENRFYVNIREPVMNLAVGTLQNFLDGYLGENKGRLDYIHGDDVVLRHIKESYSNIGFLLPAIDKKDLFMTVICDGALPRKTFSMGHPWEKRYYLEARRI